mmetsp:Transcript_5291/g.8728  ORF Transcript_5291/g.8728 Transcript_5291/m.8728 type:complete len:252 (+) Transcript_5291:276-1031(+)
MSTLVMDWFSRIACRIRAVPSSPSGLDDKFSSMRAPQLRRIPSAIEAQAPGPIRLKLMSKHRSVWLSAIASPTAMPPSSPRPFHPNPNRLIHELCLRPSQRSTAPLRRMLFQLRSASMSEVFCAIISPKYAPAFTPKSLWLRSNVVSLVFPVTASANSFASRSFKWFPLMFTSTRHESGSANRLETALHPLPWSLFLDRSTASMLRFSFKASAMTSPPSSNMKLSPKLTHCMFVFSFMHSAKAIAPFTPKP